METKTKTCWRFNFDPHPFRGPAPCLGVCCCRRSRRRRRGCCGCCCGRWRWRCGSRPEQRNRSERLAMRPYEACESMAVLVRTVLDPMLGFAGELTTHFSTILVGIGMFTGGTGFDPWSNQPFAPAPLPPEEKKTKPGTPVIAGFMTRWTPSLQTQKLRARLF